MQYLLLLAILPAVLLLFFVWKKDPAEKEPVDMLLKLAGFGALTTISAMILEAIIPLSFGLVFEKESIPFIVLENFLSVALAEEGGKFFMLRWRTWKSPEFDYSYDAVVYSVAVSMGFATIENILYVFLSENSLSVAIMRAILSVPGHAFFAVFMGYFYGIAKLKDYLGEKKDVWKYYVLALLVPILLHGTYDFLLTVGTTLSMILFFVFEIMMTVAGILLIIKGSKNTESVAPVRAASFTTKPPVPPIPPYPGQPMPYQPGYPQMQRPIQPGYMNPQMPQRPVQQGFVNPQMPQRPVQQGFVNPQMQQRPVQQGFVNPQMQQRPVQQGFVNPQMQQRPVQQGYINPQMPQQRPVQQEYMKPQTAQMAPVPPTPQMAPVPPTPQESAAQHRFAMPQIPSSPQTPQVPPTTQSAQMSSVPPTPQESAVQHGFAMPQIPQAPKLPEPPKLPNSTDMPEL